VRDIPTLVAPLGWHFAYVPGRRNRLRPPGAADADRGTAILSSLPLSHIEAIELPIERQRRVAVSAVVAGSTTTGQSWRLRVVSVHLENRSGARRLWARAGASRSRQTEALLDALAVSPTAAADPAMPMLVGGDFNTWLGRGEGALQLLRARFEPWPDEDTRPTIDVRQWRLDYLFPRLPPATRTSHRRLDALYGSDHYPVVAAIDFGTN
jgi:endonuclease/exonuclease/phosphatase family metal-dependent hydrolase